ncbi:MAG: PspC domain-containing protein [Lacisediminihabitans sp.]
MSTAAQAPRMSRPRDVLVGGVCAGLAEHLGWRVRRVRALAIVLAVCGGAGLLLYLWLWALTPLQPARADESAQVRRRAPLAVILLVLGGIAALFAVGSLSARITLVPSILEMTFLLAAAVAWSLGFDRTDPGRSRRLGVVVRSVSAALLILIGGLTLTRGGSVMTVVLAIVMVVLGVGVLVAPAIVRLATRLLGERAARAREEQRAEIAAHLHDSVLQTLALIQNRAGASSEVARIARAQERELRDWLFAGTASVGDDLAIELREVAAAIELDYPARIDIVTAGESSSAPSAALIAAAREAMLNAARHVGGEVSVYLEMAPSAVDVYIRDRGPGIDLATLPADRLGIRESIIGRMTRAGGTATVGPGIGGVGTEVHLHLGDE